MNSGFNEQTKQSDEWETPDWLFKALDSEFGFTLDGAATEENAKCEKFCTKHTPADSWANQRVFCNPPYSEIEYFVRRAYTAEAAVLVLPVRTDSDWHRLLIEHGAELRYFRRRVAFLENGKPQGSPRFATMIAVVKGTL